MLKLPVGIQLWSVREDLKNDFEGTLKKLKEIGYDAVEFAGLFDHSAEEVRDLCKRIGINPISAHVSWKDLSEDENVAKTYATIGCKYIGIGYGPAQLIGGPEHEKMHELVRKISENCKKYGITLMYHNHDWELEYYMGQHKLDHLYEEFDADTIQAEIDTAWVRITGEDPSVYIRRYTDRLPLMHLKDFSGVRHCWADPETFGIETSYFPPKPFEYRPIGYGEQNIPNLVAAAEETHVKMLIVEQDNPSLGKTALECAKMSIDYLRSL